MNPGVHAETQGEKIAYRMAGTDETVTYSQLNAASNRAAHLFRHQGLVPGDGIAILLKNHESYLKIAWAAQRSGLYYTPISTFFQHSEITYILKNSDVKILITMEEYLTRLDVESLRDISIFLVDAAHSGAAHSGAAHSGTAHSGAAHSGIPDWDRSLDEYPTTPITDECEGAEMIYSSGTTGVPKGVRFSLKQAPLGSVSSLFETRVKLHGISADTRYLSTAPLYHSAPLRYSMMVTRLGGTATIMEKFDPEFALNLIQRERITHSQWVPTMFVRMLKLPEETRKSYDVSSLQYVIHAAAPCPIDIKQKMIDWFGPKIYEYYSGTEANGSTAITTPEWLAHRGSVGRAIHGELKILDDNGVEVPTGETGTVYFANGSDFSYYKDPEKTTQAKTREGWSTLGDVGYVDGEAYLYLRDRKSFMIISGGVNIYPQETENILINHPLVADVAVFGVPNQEFGEEVKAVVQLMDPGLASDELSLDLIDYCRQQISHVKCPKSVDFITQLPRHPTGKLYKKKLRDDWLVRHAKIEQISR